MGVGIITVQKMSIDINDTKSEFVISLQVATQWFATVLDTFSYFSHQSYPFDLLIASRSAIKAAIY